MSMIEYQRRIMADSVRTEAFAKALKNVIQPGCTVLDIGSGTGFLAFLASKYGAGKCILIEREPEFLLMSKEIAKANGINNCEFICADSNEVRDAIKADIIVSETLGNFAYEENIIETLRDAKRFLKPGGVMIPQGIRMYVSPVINDHHWKENTAWDTVGYAMDWSPARSRSVNNMYVKTFAPNDLIPAKEWDAVDFLKGKPESVRTGNGEWGMGHACAIYGLCLSWECDLLSGITIATHAASAPTHWEQIFLPCEVPIHCKNGDTFECIIRSDSRPSVKINVEWELKHRSNGKTLSHQLMNMRRGK